MFILGSLDFVVDFLLVLIELFCYVLWLRRCGQKWIENRRFANGWVISTEFWHGRGCPIPIIFASTVRPMNALQLFRWQFSHKETL